MYFDPIEAGMRLRDLREQAGYSQEKFSEKLNISRNYLAKVETGLRQPSVDLWIEIAVTAGTSLDYLILGIVPEDDIKQKMELYRMKQKAKEEIQNAIDGLLRLQEELG